MVYNGKHDFGDGVSHDNVLRRIRASNRQSDHRRPQLMPAVRTSGSMEIARVEGRLRHSGTDMATTKLPPGDAARAVQQADTLWGYATALGWEEIWMINVAEEDRDKVLQGVQRRLVQFGGAVHHIPIPKDQRRIFAVFGVKTIGEVGFATFRRFYTDGERITSYEDLLDELRDAYAQRDHSGSRRAGSRDEPLP